MVDPAGGVCCLLSVACAALPIDESAVSTECLVHTQTTANMRTLVCSVLQRWVLTYRLSPILFHVQIITLSMCVLCSRWLCFVSRYGPPDAPADRLSAVAMAAEHRVRLVQRRRKQSPRLRVLLSPNLVPVAEEVTTPPVKRPPFTGSRISEVSLN
ncbi:hypothetical protein N656DRAFT_611943 [Canariomyces notabilis]|uniref:Secreted protein n=1 Tax=Canariomyces notabilis TaxID=2074819 RepID=A0AAN6TGK4_9PEZI|nr:hypothetical protein N656DRAFT_611943 [Canariomyces arenarius]